MNGSDSRSVECGNERVAGGFTVLYKTIFDAGSEQMVFDPLIFLIADFAVKAGIIGGASVWNVLPHQAEQNLAGVESLRNPVDDPERVFDMTRQQKMTDDDAAGHKPALIVEAAGACLTEHFPDGAFCRLKVLFRV